MARVITTVLAAAATAGVLLTGAPAASVQPGPGSVVAPIVVPRPFDIPIWQLPPLPYPLEWEFHLPPAPTPPPAPARPPAPATPKLGDVCPSSQIGTLSPNKLRCTFMGTPNPARWVEVAPSALNPDGTLKPNAGG